MKGALKMSKVNVFPMDYHLNSFKIILKEFAKGREREFRWKSLDGIEWGEVFREIKRHSRFKYLGEMVDSITGFTYIEVIKYKGKCYYASRGFVEDVGDVSIIFVKVKKNNNKLEFAEEFPYYVTDEQYGDGARQPNMYSFRTKDELMEKVNSRKLHFRSAAVLRYYQRLKILE